MFLALSNKWLLDSPTGNPGVSQSAAVFRSIQVPAECPPPAAPCGRRQAAAQNPCRVTPARPPSPRTTGQSTRVHISSARSSREKADAISASKARSSRSSSRSCVIARPFSKSRTLVETSPCESFPAQTATCHGGRRVFSFHSACSSPRPVGLTCFSPATPRTSSTNARAAIRCRGGSRAIMSATVL